MKGRREDDWGPFPDLAAMLGRMGPAWARHPARWARMCEQFGGFWGLYAPEILGRGAIAPPNPAPAVEWSLWQGLIAFFRRLMGRSGPRPAAQSGRDFAPADVAKVLVHCHCWLGQRILEWASPLFVAPWKQSPRQMVALAAVSQKAIAWTLLAWAFDRHGERVLVPLEGGDLLPPRYRLDDDSLFGDCLSLHIHIERALAKIARPAEQGEPHSLYRPGGLRKEAFWRTYMALRENVYPGLQDWGVGLNRLVAGSPLTQLLYADLFDTAPSRVTIRPLACPTADPVAWDHWHHMWISHLASSLVAVILSPSPFGHKRRRLEAENRRLQADHPTPEMRRRQQEVARELEQVMQRIFTHHVSRIRFLGSLFEDRRRIAYLHVRTLDMLIRHVFSRSRPMMRQQWLRVRQDPDAPRPHSLFIGDGRGRAEPGVCYVDFLQAVLGCASPEELLQYPNRLEGHGDGTIDLLRNDVRVLLSPWLQETRDFTSTPADDLNRRFNDVGIEQPCPFPDDFGLPPRPIVGAWQASILTAWGGTTTDQTDA